MKLKKLGVAMLVAAAGSAALARQRFEYAFDTSGAPELAAFTARRLAPAVREWYPKLVDMFPSQGWKPYGKVTFEYKDGISCPAYAAGPRVTIQRKWLKENPGDIGCVIHELMHVVQGGYRRTPDWITEGVADYVRWYIFEPESRGCEMDVRNDDVRFNGSYRVSANFLNYVESHFPGIVKDLNALCRNGKYSEAFWKSRTGKTVFELEDGWKGKGRQGRRGAAQAPAVRVMTYNIRCAGGDRMSADNNWNVRRKELAHAIDRENPDIIGFQEVDPDQYAWLKARLTDYAFLGKGRNAHGGEASPIAYRKSRFDLVRAETFWLSKTPDVPGSKGWDAAHPRVCTYAILKDKATGRKFSFANTHLDHVGGVARAKGMSLILAYAKKKGKGVPLVLTGDFNCHENDGPVKTADKTLKNAMYISKTAPEGSWRTFNGWRWRDREMPIAEALKRKSRQGGASEREFGAGRIDYIYVSPGTEVLDYRTVSASRPGKRLYPSDHFPCVSTLVFK